MSNEPEIIDLDSSSDEDIDSPVIDLEDWTPQTPIEDSHPDNEASVIDPQTQYSECLSAVTECFPDISHDYVQALYSEYIASVELTEAANAKEVLIGRILDRKTYPKEKDHLKDLKRKRSKDEVDEKAEVAKWKAEVEGIEALMYARIS